AEELLSHDLDAVFLSNGPGDPAELTGVINEIKKLVGKLPIVGICLGHQLLAWALGGTTKKLKYGHRGCNHPVKDLEKNRIFITSQNHGYVVDKVPDSMKVTHINLNDNSIEGMRSEEHRILCVQYHPEAWPGPADSEYLFDDFLAVIEG
ncbi:MAG: glutamine amidotransferase-related protein, partial [Cetobacterium sp.]